MESAQGPASCKAWFSGGRSGWPWATCTLTASSRRTRPSRPSTPANWRSGSRSMTPGARQLAQHRGDQSEHALRIVGRPLRSEPAGNERRDQGLDHRSEPATNRDQLDFRVRVSTDQSEEPTSDTLAVDTACTAKADVLDAWPVLHAPPIPLQQREASCQDSDC